MKKLIITLIITFCPFFSCVGQENQSVFISNEKINLRYSTRSDVEKILGNPEITEFYEHGGEDFFWKNFTFCSYDENKLSFHYDQNGAIIRMTVNAGYSGEVRFLGKNIKLLSREVILNFVKNLDERYLYFSKSFIMYENAPKDDVTYGFWFDDNENIKWIDMYYISPW